MSKRLQYRVSFIGTQKTVNECKILAAAYGLDGEAGRVAGVVGI